MQYRGVHRLARTVDIAAVGEARNRIFVAAILHGARLTTVIDAMKMGPLDSA